MVDPLDAPARTFEPRDAPVVKREVNYYPEIPYPETNYKPVGREFHFDDDGNKIYGPTPRGKKKCMQGPDTHFCKRCVDYYQVLAKKRLYPKGEWSLGCEGDYAWRMDKYTDEEVAQLGLSEEEEAYFRLSLDPVRWAEYEFGLKLDWYQGDMVRCSSPWKVVRGGRRIGKTTDLGIDILYACYTKFGMNKPRYEYLIICPYEAQVKKIFDNLEILVAQSVNLRAAVKATRKSPHWEMEFHNGSIVRGFSSGKKTGARSEKIRGQDADAIGFDEIDYMADEDIEAIFAMLGSQENVRLWMSSTPTGARSKFWRVATDKTQGFKEFWFVSNESPRWTPRAEKFFKAMYSDSGYNREFNAEFGTPSEGVFRQPDLDACLRDYRFIDCERQPKRKYVIGVDWNKLTGTHIVVLEGDYEKKKGPRFAVVDKKIVRPQEFTQVAGIEAVIEMDRKWSADYIYVDEGYGATQVELLHRIDVQQPAAGTRYKERVVAIEMSKKVEFRDPRKPGLFIKKAAKPFMIDMLAGWISSHQMVLPAEEDTDVSIIEEELAYLDVGLVQQMREFRVENTSPTGQIRYTQGYEHTLTALALAAMGHALQFSELNQNWVDERVIVHEHPFGTPNPKADPEGAAEHKARVEKRKGLREKTRPRRDLVEKPKKRSSTMTHLPQFMGGRGLPKRKGFYDRIPGPSRRIP